MINELFQKGDSCMKSNALHVSRERLMALKPGVHKTWCKRELWRTSEPRSEDIPDCDCDYVYEDDKELGDACIEWFERKAVIWFIHRAIGTMTKRSWTPDEDGRFLENQDGAVPVWWLEQELEKLKSNL